MGGPAPMGSLLTAYIFLCYSQDVQLARMSSSGVFYVATYSGSSGLVILLFVLNSCH